MTDGIIEVVRGKDWPMPVVAFYDAKGTVNSGSNLIGFDRQKLTHYREKSDIPHFTSAAYKR